MSAPWSPLDLLSSTQVFMTALVMHHLRIADPTYRLLAALLGLTSWLFHGTYSLGSKRLRKVATFLDDSAIIAIGTYYLEPDSDLPLALVSAYALLFVAVGHPWWLKRLVYGLGLISFLLNASVQTPPSVLYPGLAAMAAGHWAFYQQSCEGRWRNWHRVVWHFGSACYIVLAGQHIGIPNYSFVRPTPAPMGDVEWLLESGTGR